MHKASLLSFLCIFSRNRDCLTNVVESQRSIFSQVFPSDHQTNFSKFCDEGTLFYRLLISLSNILAIFTVKDTKLHFDHKHDTCVYLPARTTMRSWLIPPPHPILSLHPSRLFIASALHPLLHPSLKFFGSSTQAHLKLGERRIDNQNLSHWMSHHRFGFLRAPNTVVNVPTNLELCHTQLVHY